MIAAEADLLRKVAQACCEADRVTLQLARIHAPKPRQVDAEQNSLNAGRTLNLVILRWLGTL